MKQLEIDKAEVLQNMHTFNTEDSERASDVGESRQRIGAFLEKTGINNKAFATCRAVLRMKKDDKRQDWLRSMRALMVIMEEQIAANGTRDAFDVPAEAKAQAAEPARDDAQGPADAPEDEDDTFPEDDEPTRLEGDEAEAAALKAETEAFEEDLAKYEGNVKPFAPKKAGRKKAVAAE